jgi:hypothetical protein
MDSDDKPIEQGHKRSKKNENHPDNTNAAVGIPQSLMTVNLYEPQARSPPQTPLLSEESGSLLSIGIALMQCEHSFKHIAHTKN